MKKLLKLLLVLMVIITATACGSDKDQNDEINNNDNVQNEQSGGTSIEDQLTNETETNQNDVLLTDIKISEYGASNIVTGKVKNLKNQNRNIELVLKMYNSKNNKLLGRATIVVENLAANEERGFELSIMGDYTTVDKFEVEAKDL